MYSFRYKLIHTVAGNAYEIFLYILSDTYVCLALQLDFFSKRGTGCLTLLTGLLRTGLGAV